MKAIEMHKIFTLSYLGSVVKRCLDGRGLLFSLCVCSFVYCTTLSPPFIQSTLSVHAHERSQTYVTSHARHGMRMGWGEANLSSGTKKTLALQKRGKQAGMDVRKPSSVTKINLSISFPSLSISLSLAYCPLS